MHILAASSGIPGRFALDACDGTTLSSGQVIEVLLGGHWIPGRVEYKTLSSISAKDLIEAQGPTRWYDGYYFVAGSDNTECALCIGMTVRLP